MCTSSLYHLENMNLSVRLRVDKISLDSIESCCKVNYKFSKSFAKLAICSLLARKSLILFIKSSMLFMSFV
ncbi:hypothetical protein DCO58_00045 [Helicobacter saguini]|uniref:Uncharacterized protein n=1 Tax=Helicobacter saguini TaxID=1548018 RepID=A0A4U8T8P5_9HELI|nr:hypothetical protein [Helicobacter saguini]MWV63211.1 hypothetical protein [Helicobacter saguini]MWV66120.1 hypothetical protein [Helicobacter saguini]MWV68470.1 hypothetical protein [Helicobacter saguini]MWV71976.1 hypothetical protein [Helicobacter saguini]TLD95983.1 hypothetical protein LS64_001105 [Helicobacter saguini]